MSNNARDIKFWADMIFYTTDGRPAFVVLENYVGGHTYIYLLGNVSKNYKIIKENSLIDKNTGELTSIDLVPN